MKKETINKYFKDGETAQKTLEQLGLFEQVAKQYILTQNMDMIKEFISLRPEEDSKVEKLEKRLKWIEESTNDYINSIGGIDNSDQFRILNDILIACDLNDHEPEEYWDNPKEKK